MGRGSRTEGVLIGKEVRKIAVRPDKVMAEGWPESISWLVATSGAFSFWVGDELNPYLNARGRPSCLIQECISGEVGRDRPAGRTWGFLLSDR